MKKYKTLLIALIICFICTLAIGLTACSSGETGAQGEKGETGATGATGAQGEKGEDGASAYELYLQNNPDYTGTEAEWLLTLYGEDGKSAYQLYCDANTAYTGDLNQWLDDLANGRLATVKYTVTFDANGGTEVESQTVTKGGKATQPVSTRTGYTLEGWYYGEEKWSFIGYSVTEDITLTANWVLTNQELNLTAVYDTENTSAIASYTIGTYNGTDTEIEIPAYYNGYPVTAIAASAFASKTAITSVTVPETVTSFGENAFNSCTGLTAVYYEGTVSQWASITFGNAAANPLRCAYNLYLPNADGEYELATDITISGIEKVNDYAFYYCKSLTSVEFASGVTAIGTNAFTYCSGLTSVIVSVSVTSFGSNAFSSATGSVTGVYYGGTASQWASITFGNTFSVPFYRTNLYLANANGGYDLATEITIDVATVNTYAFTYCWSIVSVTLSSNVTSIGNAAFSSCYHIIEVINNSELSITAGNTGNGNIANYAYYVYTSASTDSGKFLTQDDYTFYAHTDGDSTNYYLVKYDGTETDLELPDLKIEGTSTIYAIKQYAFDYNIKITSVIIPDTVDCIDASAFQNCTSLTSVIIGDGVGIILKNAFYGCTSLSSIVIGSGVKTIQQNAFYNCSALTSVYYNGTSQSSITTISTTGNTALTDATATWYYYSETEPADTTGNYWHYVNGVPAVWTTEQTESE